VTPITNIIAADEDDYAAVGESMRPLDEWSGIDGCGLDTAKVTMLHCLVTGDDYDLSLTLHEPSYVAEGGAVVLRLADRVLQKLAIFNEGALGELSTELAATVDFENEQWSVDDVHALLSELAGLARLAESQDQSLFVWIHPAEAGGAD
jgi:hypothetical protein